MRLVFILIISLLFGSNVYTQAYLTIDQADKKSQKCFKKGKEAQSKKEFEKAIKHYQKVLKKEPNVIDANLALASSFLGIKNNDQAIVYFEKVVALDPSYEPKVLYTLHKLYEEKKNIPAAKKNLALYIDQLDSNDKKRKKAEATLRQLEVRDSLMSNPVPFNPIALDAKINSGYQEYLPALTADNEQLIFTRKDIRQEDFFMAKFEKDRITEVIWLESLNTLGNEGAHCISQDGKLIIFTACDRRDGKGSCDLYYAVKRNGHWSEPKNLGSSINSEAWDSQPTLSSDGKTLYFASARDGGKGGKDIWVSRLVDRRWSKPVNLPGNVNTSGEEASPFIHPDNQTLYFRSNKHPGMGGFDIFFSKRTKSSFDNIQNIGYPINTIGNEGALFVSLDGNTAYFASDHQTGNLDIYKFGIPDYAKPIPTSYIKLKIKDATTLSPLSASLLIVDLETRDTVLQKDADSQGEVIATVSKGTQYGIYVEESGYIFYSENIAFDELQSIEPLIKEIDLIPIKKIDSSPTVHSEPIILKNIFFESGSSALLPNSSEEIAKLENLLSSNPTMKIQIIGHTDNVGEENDNLDLSNARANSVKLALQEKGILASRLTSKGMGESDPIASNETPEGRAQNRRTTFIITSN